MSQIALWHENTFKILSISTLFLELTVKSPHSRHLSPMDFFLRNWWNDAQIPITKTCINCKWWLYFSFIISELNIFIFFRHYNLLFDISFKAVFNFNISSILKTGKQKCQKCFFFMIMHECIEIFYKNFFYKNFLYDVSFLFLVLIINQNVFFLTFFWYINWMFSLIFITKNTKADGILFFNFVNVSNFDWKFHVIKIKLFGKIYVSFCNSSWLMTCKI